MIVGGIMDYFEQTTKRLNLRKVVQGDVASWTEFFIDNPGLKYLAIDTTHDPKDLSKKWIDKQQQRYAHHGYGMLAAVRKKDQQLIGMGGILIQEINEKKEFEIAYSIKPRYWNQGYATEIAQQLMCYAKEHHIAERVVSIIDKENIASIKVAEKNGMDLLFDTHFFDLDVYVYGASI